MPVRRQYKLTIKQGAEFMRHFQCRNGSTGAVIDLTTDLGITTGSLVIKPDYDEDAVVTLTTGNGGLVIANGTKSNGFEYSGYIYMSAAATGALTDWGEGVFDMMLGDGSICDGVAVLSPTTIT